MCGISLYLGKNYNRAAFKILSLYSDVFGRDNSGVAYWDRKGELVLEKGGPAESWALCFDLFPRDYCDYTEAAPLMADMLTTKHSLPAKNYGKTVMTFSRKATVGNKSPESAQPFIVEGTRPVLMVHNGTITNWEKLLELSGLPDSPDDMLSDSYALGRAIAEEEHLKWFELYSGQITCVWVYLDTPNEVYAFVGGSRSITVPRIMKADRTLYLLRNKAKDSFYLSRSWDAIELIGNFLTEPGKPADYVGYTVLLNTIVKFTPKGDFKVKEIVRNPLTYKPTVVSRNLNTLLPPAGRTSHRSSTSIFESDTPSNSFRCLDFYDGRYHLGGELMETGIFYDESVSPTIHVLKESWIDPDTSHVYTKSYGKDEEEKFYYFTDPNQKRPLVVKSEVVKRLRQHYFFEGQLFQSKVLFEMFIRRYSQQSFTSLTYQGYVINPIWSGSANRRVIKDSPNYIHPYFHLWDTFVFNGEGKAVHQVEGNIVLPYIPKVYIFKNSRLLKITSLKRKVAKKLWEKRLVPYLSNHKTTVE